MRRERQLQNMDRYIERERGKDSNTDTGRETETGTERQRETERERERSDMHMTEKVENYGKIEKQIQI